VHNATISHQREIADDEPESESSGLLASARNLVVRNPRDTLIAIVVSGLVAAIFVNGLFLQPGPHPAPIFAIRPSPVASNDATGAIQLPRRRPSDTEISTPSSPVPARTRAAIMSDIQKELSRRGFYDGTTDGVYGAKTDAAIRDFEHAANLRPSSEPNEALLQSILRSTIKAPTSAHAQRNDAIGELLGPSRQLIAVQRALSDYGYGPLKASGVYDADTRASIERFERDRKLPITGQVSERLTRELVAMTGRPLE